MKGHGTRPGASTEKINSEGGQNQGEKKVENQWFKATCLFIFLLFGDHKQAVLRGLVTHGSTLRKYSCRLRGCQDWIHISLFPYLQYLFLQTSNLDILRVLLWEFIIGALEKCIQISTFICIFKKIFKYI